MANEAGEDLVERRPGLEHRQVADSGDEFDGRINERFSELGGGPGGRQPVSGASQDECRDVDRTDRLADVVGQIGDRRR